MDRDLHSAEFKEQALLKARQRGNRTLGSIANELNMSLHTLKGWLKLARPKPAVPPHAAELPDDVPAHQWSAPQRLLALHESHALSGTALHAWCREKGVFEHQLQQWNGDFCAMNADHTIPQRQANAALRELQGKHDLLQRELRRKDKALAEAAALLVLQKNEHRSAVALRPAEVELVQAYPRSQPRGAADRHIGGLPRKKTWLRGSCGPASGDAFGRSRLGN